MSAPVAIGALHEHALGFVDLLRRRGIVVPIESSLCYGESLAHIDIGEGDQVYWAGRATLVTTASEIATYDAAFAEYWLRHETPSIPRVEESRLEVRLAVDDPDAAPPEDEPDDDGDEPTLTLRYSSTEVLRHKDFAEYTSAELAESREIMARIAIAGSPRPSRRRRRASGLRGRLDLQRTIDEALRTEGEALRLLRNERSTRVRRLVLLLDVSGSMEPYARALIRFVHAAVVGRARVEAFALGTRLTRMTKELSSRDPDRALVSAGQRVSDWSGGTRLGDTLAGFNDQWGVRGLARNAVVVVLSDGWDRGEPQLLAEQMARLSRVAHRIIWVNPLKASPGYQPLAAGMAAALPYVDVFIEGHSISSLEHLAEAIDA